MAEQPPTVGGAAGARLQALREQGREHLDPVRFRFIEALARRGAGLQGRARALLEARLARALDDYPRASVPDSADVAEQSAVSAARPLADLLAHIARLASGGGDASATTGTPGESSEPGRDPAGDAAAPGELKSVAYFRDTWISLSVDQELSAALAQAPDNAGPLNSHILALQSLELMRDIAPDYLQHFVTYADGLLWLDQAESAGKPAGKAAARGDKDKGEKADKAGRKARAPAKPRRKPAQGDN